MQTCMVHNSDEPLTALSKIITHGRTNRLVLCVQTKNKQLEPAGESGYVTLRIQLARHIAAPVFNKCKVEHTPKKGQRKDDTLELNPFLSFV